jgi:hypothetical protein
MERLKGQTRQFGALGNKRQTDAYWFRMTNALLFNGIDETTPRKSIPVKQLTASAYRALRLISEILNKELPNHE